MNYAIWAIKALPQGIFGGGPAGIPLEAINPRDRVRENLIPDCSRRREDGARAPGTGDSRMFYFIAASTARLAITVMRCAR